MIVAPLPATSDSGVVVLGGETFVVLRKDDHVLAVYQVTKSKVLTRVGRAGLGAINLPSFDCGFEPPHRLRAIAPDGQRFGPVLATPLTG
jgi:hypothetical protein